MSPVEKKKNLITRTHISLLRHLGMLGCVPASLTDSFNLSDQLIQSL